MYLWAVVSYLSSYERINLPIHLSNCLFIYHLPICPSIHQIHRSTRLSIYQSVELSSYQPLKLSTYQPIIVSLYQGLLHHILHHLYKHHDMYIHTHCDCRTWGCASTCLNILQPRTLLDPPECFQAVALALTHSLILLDLLCAQLLLRGI